MLEVLRSLSIKFNFVYTEYEVANYRIMIIQDSVGNCLFIEIEEEYGNF